MQTQTLNPLPAADAAFMQVLYDLPTDTPVTDALVGGDFRYDPETMPWYIQITRMPGGRSDQLQGEQVIDIDVFSVDYNIADSLAFSVDALALGYPHVVEVEGRKVVIDRVYQNVAPAELPWESDSVYRIGATYSITVRRN